MATDFPLKLGDKGQYELSQVALNHIVEGDTAVRPVTTPTGRSHVIALSGGLHTYAGWTKFLSNHPNIAHLFDFQFGVHDAWYFARELQNGVVTLKIPRRLFTGDAASITRQPDNYFKSGYLWKTLFPVSYSEADILRSIQEALVNLDREDSVEPTTEQPMGVLYGYAAVEDPLTAIKIRIQVRGHEIVSAFPSWEQPYTGNNGKPYSPEHSIGFQFARSTLGYETFVGFYGPVFQKEVLDINALIDRTPEFIKSRVIDRKLANVDEIRRDREATLQEYARAARPDDLDVIETYLADYPCAKDPFRAQQTIYINCSDLIDRSQIAFNAAQFAENVGECIWVLSFCDNVDKTRRAIAAIVRFLEMAIVHVGGLNTLMFKALIGKMIAIAADHHDPDALKDVLAALSASPSRAALYTEFDLNPFVKKNDEQGLLVIGLPSIKITLTVDHLIEFIAFNLGENYLLHFDKGQRLNIAAAIVDGQVGRRLAEDVMSKFTGSDFDFFMPAKLDPSALGNKNLPEEPDLVAIVRDYGRMLLVLRQRIVLEDHVAYKTQPDHSKIGEESYFELIRQKHKHALVFARHQSMLEDVKAFADRVGYARLSAACLQALNRFGRDQIPLPKHIPDYIESWMKVPGVGAFKGEDLVGQILGEQAAQAAFDA